MHKIERNIVNAILAGQSGQYGNSRVLTVDDTTALYLHENLIAVVTPGCVKVDLCGWPTVTTRSRINAVLDCLGLPWKAQQIAHQQFLCSNGDERIPMPRCGGVCVYR